MTGIFGPAIELVREFHRDKGLPVSDALETAPRRPQLWAIGKRVVEEAVELRAAVGAGTSPRSPRSWRTWCTARSAWWWPIRWPRRSLARLREPATRDPVRLSEEIVVGSMNLRDGLGRRDPGRVSRELALVLFDALHLTIVTDLPLDEAFLDIHENNMTKRPARRRRGVVQKPEKGPEFEKLDLSRLLPDAPERER